VETEGTDVQTYSNCWRRDKNMGKTDLQHKAKIDAIMNAYLSKLAGLKKKRNQIVSDFLDVLAQKKIKQIKESLR
jgi:hypothetical protein